VLPRSSEGGESSPAAGPGHASMAAGGHESPDGSRVLMHEMRHRDRRGDGHAALAPLSDPNLLARLLVLASRDPPGCCHAVQNPGRRLVSSVGDRGSDVPWVRLDLASAPGPVSATVGSVLVLACCSCKDGRSRTSEKRCKI